MIIVQLFQRPHGRLILTTLIRFQTAHTIHENRLKMVESKFWSTFSECTEEELAAGLEELRVTHQGEDVLDFVDKLIFIVGRKIA